MVEKNKKYKIFLATGGSGGHIFPALAIADKLTESGYSICVIADSIYEKYSSQNFNYRIINTGKDLKSFKSIKNIVFGFFQVLSLIKKEKPDLVVSFGSYATLPTLIACVKNKTPFILHEQNAYIGKINKLFGKYAKKIMTSYHELYGIKYDDMEKIIYTGNPVRKEIKKLYNVQYKYPEVDEKFIVVITGGSSGAKIFSEDLPKIFDFVHKDQQKKIKIYHQVREEYLNEVKDYYRKINLESSVSIFFNNMSELLEKANLIIGRSGSGTLNETFIAGKPSILIPLANSSNNHQEINAKIVEKNNAGVVVLEKNFNVEDFQKLFFNLIQDKSKLEEMAKNAKKMAVLNADENILNVIKENL